MTMQTIRSGFSPLDALPVTSENKSSLLAGTPLFFRLVCNVLQQLHYGVVILNLPDGRVLKFTGKEELDSISIINIKDFAFARRTILAGDNGFFESFVDEEWSTPDLAACLYVFARNADYIEKAFHGNPFFAWTDWMRHAFNRNTKSGSRKNIMAHYDLGNDFYEKWLDPGMTYSAALFSNNAMDLETAQQQKYQNLTDMIDLQPDETVLEIGCGWGGFAEHAAKTIGASVTGITISQAQYDYARQRIFDAGLNEKVTLEMRDYRDLEGQYDKVVSIEMFEAVGKEYWDTYFDKIQSVLKPGGQAGLQVITIADHLFAGYEKSTDFIQRYVFPGGMLPSPSLLRSHVEKSGLSWKNEFQFGRHYADTLNQWHHRFNSVWEELHGMGFDARFKKLWQFYLAYCEAGFRAATTDVYQVAATKS